MGGLNQVYSCIILVITALFIAQCNLQLSSPFFLTHSLTRLLSVDLPSGFTICLVNTLFVVFEAFCLVTFLVGKFLTKNQDPG